MKLGLVLATLVAFVRADPASILSIQNTINTYPLAIDSKNFSALSLVFTPDAVANYSAPLGVLHGLPNIQYILAKNLAPVTTQHALSTMVVDLGADGTSARTKTYYTATHFGHGLSDGQIYVAYGRYEDTLSLTAQGWRITYRHLIYMVSAAVRRVAADLRQRLTFILRSVGSQRGQRCYFCKYECDGG